MNLDSLSLQLCDIQGRLFELSRREGCASAAFAEAFMTGNVSEHFDLPYDRSQWMGEEYLFEDVEDDAGGISRTGEIYDQDELYWMGYTYRYWHFLTGESSRTIYETADAPFMRRVYPAYHTLDTEAAIERIKETNQEET